MATAVIGFSNPSITVNNVTIAIQPDSFEFTPGKGVQVVRAMSAGGGIIIPVATEDVKSQVGKMKYGIAVTQANRQYFSNWKDNIGLNVIIATDENGNQCVGNNMSCTTEEAWKASADGWLEVEFQGSPLSEA